MVRADLYAGVSGNDVAVVHSAAGDLGPYRMVVDVLRRAGVPFDVVVFPDGVTAPDRITGADLFDYEQLILATGGEQLTDGQVTALAAFLRGGGCVVHVGGPGRLAHPNVRPAPADDLGALLQYDPQVRVDGGALSTNIKRLPDGRSALHVVNHGRAAVDARLDVSLSRVYARATAHHADGRVVPLELRTEQVGFRHHVMLAGLGPSAIVEFA